MKIFVIKKLYEFFGKSEEFSSTFLVPFMQMNEVISLWKSRGMIVARKSMVDSFKGARDSNLTGK